MLPLPLQFIVAMVAYAINERMARRSEYRLAWFRQLAAKKHNSSTQRKKPGKPREPDEIRELFIRLARENLGWGCTKIRDALRGLKVEIGRSTVASIVKEAGLEPAHE
jgi:putative transposase